MRKSAAKVGGAPGELAELEGLLINGLKRGAQSWQRSLGVGAGGLGMDRAETLPGHWERLGWDKQFGESLCCASHCWLARIGCWDLGALGFSAMGWGNGDSVG